MARERTVWSVVGPVKDPETKEIVVMTVRQGSVTGDRLDVVFAGLEKYIARFAEENGAQVADYVIDITKEADTRDYFKYAYDLDAAKSADGEAQ